MMPESVTLQQVLDAIEKLRQEVSSLSVRVTTLEAAVTKGAVTKGAVKQGAVTEGAGPTAAPDSVEGEGLSEELVLTISAAIAAYLGLKPHIRQIRLLGSPSWGHQGRVTVQASHAMSVHHGGAPFEA